MRYKKNKGQSLLEYALLVGIVAVALTTLSVFMRRSIQSVVKVTADQLAPQNMAEQESDDKAGHLEYSYTSSRSQQGKSTEELSGATTYRYDMGDATPWKTHIKSDVMLNLGFTNTEKN